MRIVTLGDIQNSDISCRWNPARNEARLMKYFLDSLVQPAMWTEVEPCVGIICACLPTLRPLFKECTSSLSSKYSHYASTHLSSRHIRSNRNKNFNEVGSYGVVTNDEDRKRYSHYMDQGAPSPVVRSGPGTAPSNQLRTASSEEYPMTDVSSIDRSDFKETADKV